MQDWLADHYLTNEDFMKALEERSLRLDYEASSAGTRDLPDPKGSAWSRSPIPVRHPGADWTEPLVRHLKLEGEFANAVEQTWQVMTFNDRFDELYPGVRARVGEPALVAWFSNRWTVPVNQVSAAAHSRGLSFEAFVKVGRFAYAYDWYHERHGRAEQ
jgi:hypothetical protein